MRVRTLIAATALALGVTAGLAAAAVVIYKNEFSSRADFQEIKKEEGGKRCERFGRKQKAYGVLAKRGRVDCVYRTPVQGDAKQPDHEVKAKTKVLKSTAKGVRGAVYVAVFARADKDSHYELRVFPVSKEWEIRRVPDGEGFPIEGMEGKINGIGEKNKLGLQVFGDKVTAIVNGVKVANQVDPRPGDVSGSETRFALGHGKKSKKDVLALFDNVEIRIPNP